MSRTTRREFLTALAAVGAAGPPRRPPRPVPTVEAHATVFHAHPAGANTLVRFIVVDSEAPAGRLRVFDTRNVLVGTAGVIGVGGRLYGELWMPVPAQTTVVSELEVPGLRAPLRTTHRLSATRRWTLHWITIADPVTLTRRLEALPAWSLAAELAILRATDVQGNPFAWPSHLARRADHLPVLRAAAAARDLEERFGIPASEVALVPDAVLGLPSAPLVWSGAGIRYAVSRDRAASQPFHRLESPDGSTVMAASAQRGSDPASLGFAADRDTMARAVETWLTSSPALLSPDYRPDVAVVLSTEVEPDRPVMTAAVEEWNGRFAYPRIVVGGADALFASAAAAMPVASSAAPAARPAVAEPRVAGADVERAAVERREAARRHLDLLFEPARQLAGADGTGLDAFLRRAAFPFDGYVVVNPSPITRSDVIVLPDGTEHLATNVPAIGYAYLPSAAMEPGPTYPEPGDAAIMGRKFSVRLDPRTGAIASLFERGERREWSRPDAGGLNAIAGARAIGVRRIRLAGLGNRLVVRRRVGGSTVVSTITAYDALPWLDIVNAPETPGAAPWDAAFAFDLAVGAFRWETPGGRDEATGATPPVAHLRWSECRSPDGWSALLRGLDDPYLRLELDRGEASPAGAGASDGTVTRARLVSMTAGGTSRYRIDTAGPQAYRDEPWRFGWNAEPLVVRPVAGGGAVPVPTYSRMLRVDPGILVLGVKPADRGFGVVLYLQEAMGLTRRITVAPELLGFREARRVDFVERDLDEPLPTDAAGAHLSIPGNGIVAVRLAGLELRGA